MFLRIQKNESLRSFVERNLFVFNRDLDSKHLKDFFYFTFKSPESKLIAKKIGWHGCYSFNKLLHTHTAYPWYGVIKSKYDYSYSGLEYLSRSLYGNGLIDRLAYCPICATEDKLELGYSYWRRFHRCVRVCSKHNVVLLATCPFCERPFARGGHAVDVMWNGCGGRHLGEAQPVSNTEPKALRIAQFFDGLCSAKRHIYDETATTVLGRRLANNIAEGDTQLSGSTLVSDFSFYLDHIGKDSSYKSRRNETYRRCLVELAALLYSSFDEFANDCHALDPNCPSIDSFWDTYYFQYFNSEHFIKEDYRLGAAEWSWPHFEKWKSDPFRDDYFRPRQYPRHYRCCNSGETHLIAYQPSEYWARLVAPAVPQLAGSELAAMKKWSV